MLRPLKLQQRTFASNLIQGPLAGVSTAPFRALTWRYSEPAFSYTEMISCKTILNQPDHSLKRFITIDKQEGPVGFQLSANNPQELGEAVKKITGIGASLIDLNCGCPVNKIRSKGAGSRLLADPIKLSKMIDAMKKNTHLPVSIKIRVDGNSSDKFNQQIVQVLSDAGTDFLIVHGRHWTEDYDVPCHVDQIAFFVQALKIPVIGNGDIRCVDSLKAIFASGCAGAMISRAGVGQPWLIGKLKAQLSNQDFTLPSTYETGNIFIEHIERLANLLNSEKFALLHARKFAKYYARQLKNKIEFCTSINSTSSLSEFKKICMNYYR